MEEAVLRNGDGLRQCGKRTMVKARRRFVKERIHWALVCICSNRKAIIIICCVRRGGEVEGEVGAAEELVGRDDGCGRLLLQYAEERWDKALGRWLGEHPSGRVHNRLCAHFESSKSSCESQISYVTNLES